MAYHYLLHCIIPTISMLTVRTQYITHFDLQANPEDPEGLGTYDAEMLHDIESCKKTAETRRSFKIGKLEKKASTQSDASMYFGFANEE